MEPTPGPNTAATRRFLAWFGLCAALSPIAIACTSPPPAAAAPVGSADTVAAVDAHLDSPNPARDGDAAVGGAADGEATNGSPMVDTPDGLSDADALLDVTAATDTTAVADAGADDAADGSPVDSVLGGDSAAPTEPDELWVTIASDAPLPAGAQLMVQAVPVAQVLGGLGAANPGANGISLYIGELPALPLTTLAVLPPGSWVVVAFAIGPQGPLAGAMHCLGHAPMPVQAGGLILAPIKLTLHPLSGQPDTAALCGMASPPAVFSPQPLVATPPTVWGGAHHIQATSDGDRLWVAGSQDGLVSFDLPPGNVTTALGNWTVHGGAMCNRLLHHQNHIYCSSRGGYVQVFALDAKAAKQTPQQVDLGDVQTEGMAVHQGLLWIAAHGKGLLRRSALPPYGDLGTLTGGVQDAWDVVALGPNHLAVADGKHGLRILATATPAAVAAHLSLPGISAYLQVHGTVVLVSALGGGLHAVDVANPASPQLIASAALPEPVYSALPVAAGPASAIAVTTGLHLLLMPPPQAGQPWRPLRALDSLGYAMDVDPGPPGWLRLSEFLGVRPIAFDTTNLPAAAVLMTRPTLASRVTPVGQAITATMRIHNPSAQTLQVGPLLADELPPAKGQVATLLGPVAGQWIVPPGASVDIDVQLPKTIKGNTEHRLLVYHNGQQSGPRTVRWVETTWLRPGDVLPPLTYPDGKGKIWNVQQHFAGKPGVLVVAAQSCPAAVLALASLGRDLEPLISKQKIAALAINPWDNPNKQAEVAAVAPPFPVVYSPLSTSDGHAASAILDSLLNQPGVTGPPMPLVYVIDAKGKIVLADWAYVPTEVMSAIEGLLPP